MKCVEASNAVGDWERVSSVTTTSSTPRPFQYALNAIQPDAMLENEMKL